MDPIQQPQANPINPIPTQNNTPMPGQQTNERKPIGPIVAILIIVIILIAGAIYVWGQKLHSEDIAPIPTSSTEKVTPSTEQPLGVNSSADTINTQNTASVSNADDVNSLQKEIDSSTKGIDDVNF